MAADVVALEDVDSPQGAHNVEGWIRRTVDVDLRCTAFGACRQVRLCRLRQATYGEEMDGEACQALRWTGSVDLESSTSATPQIEGSVARVRHEGGRKNSARLPYPEVVVGFHMTLAVELAMPAPAKSISIAPGRS